MKKEKYHITLKIELDLDQLGDDEDEAGTSNELHR